VRELCGEKEIVVVNSHGHVDHDSGNNQFDQVYVGRFDEPDTHEPLSDSEKDRVIQNFFTEFLEQGGSIDGWNPGPAKKVLPLEEGDVIDLGSYRLQVIETPGHSLGSLALFEEKEGWLFTGDSMLTWEVWGQLDRSAVLSVYGSSMRKLANMQDKVSVVFPAHWEESRNPNHIKAYELPPEVLSMYADGIERALESEAEWEDYPFRMSLVKTAGMMKCVYFPIGGIAFNPNRTGR
jgi:glyoxylase-like metal-dependent hydrolase (beta-lactamase superfamily II)